MPGTLYEGDIRITVANAADSVADLERLQASVERTTKSLEAARLKADLTSKAFHDMRGMDEATKSLERLNRASVDLAKARGELSNADNIYRSALKQTIAESERLAQKEERAAAAMERFNQSMQRSFSGTTGVLGAFRGVREALDSQATGLQKILQVAGAVSGVFDQFDTALQVVKQGGNIFRGLRLAIAGTAESTNPLVSGLDRASTVFDKLRRVSQFGFRFEQAYQDTLRLTKSLDQIKVSFNALREAFRARGFGTEQFASLSWQMEKASNGAASLAQQMARTGKVNDAAFRNTEEQLIRVIDRLRELREAAVIEFGADSEEVRGLDQLIGRYQVQQRELNVIRERITQVDSGVTRFVTNALSKLPIVGGLFRRTGQDAKSIGDGVDAAGRKIQGFRASVDGTAGPMNRLGSAVHFVNQDVQQAQFGFGNFTQGLAASIGVVAGLAGTLSQLDPAFGAVIAGTAAMAQRLVASFQTMANAAATDSQKIRAAVTGLGAVLTGFGGAALASVVSLGKFAAEVEAKFIGLQVAAKNLTIPMSFLNQKIEDLKTTGIETSVAIDSLLQFLKADLPVDNITDLARAAQDLAKSLGENSSAMFQRFIYFIQTGNSALLDGIGIARNASDMYLEFANSIGKTVNALTVQEKRQALINGLMKEAANVSGIYALASESVAGKLQSMTRHFNELRLEIGKEFQPLLALIVDRFTELLKSLRNMPAETKRTIGFVTALVATFGTLLGIVLLLSPSIAGLVSVVTALGISLNTLFPIIGLISLAIFGLVAAFKAIPAESEGMLGLVERLEFVMDKLGEIFGRIVAKVKELAQPFVELIQYHLPRLQAGFSNLSERLSEIFKRIFTQIPGQVSILDTLITVLKDLYSIIFQIVDHALTALEAALNQDWATFWREIGQAGINALAGLGEVLLGLLPKAVEWGANFIKSFAQGIWNTARTVIPQAMNSVGNLIARFLRGASPPPEGPLSQLDQWGKNAFESFLSGFTQADFSLFDNAIGLIRERLEVLVGDAKKKGAEIAAALVQIRQVVAEGIAGVRTGALTVEGFQGLAAQITTPVKDIFDLIAAQLKAEKASEALAALQESIDRAREARRAAIEAQQERIGAIQDEISDLNKEKGEVQKRIEEEAQRRAEMMGIVIDPELLDNLKRKLEAANRDVQRAEDVLDKVRSKRELYGITLISWEEINAQAALDLAKQKQAEAQVALQEQQDRQAELDRIRAQVEREHQAEIDAIEERIAFLQERAEQERETLERMQKEAAAAERAEQQRLDAARKYAEALARQAKLLEAALKERLEQEKLLAEAAEAAEEEEAGPTFPEELPTGWALPPPTWTPPQRPMTPEESSLLERIKEIIAGGPKAVLQAILAAVYDVAKTVLGVFGIDLDQVIAGVAEKIEGVKAWFEGVKETWNAAIQPILPIIDGIKERFQELKEKALDRLGGSFDRLRESFKDIGAAVKELWEKRLKPLFKEILESKAFKLLQEIWKTEAIVLFGAILGGVIGFILVALNTLANIIEGVINVISGLVDTVSGAFTLISGLITGDLDTIKEGFETLFGGLATLFGGLAQIILSPLLGLADTILSALGLGTVIEEFNRLKENVVLALADFVNAVVEFFKGLWRDLVGASIVPDIINGIVDLFTSLPGLIVTALINFASAVLGKIGELALSVGLKVQEVINAILAPFDLLRLSPPEFVISVLTQGFELAQSLIETISTLWQTLLDKVGSKSLALTLSNITDWVAHTISSISDFWQGLLDRISHKTLELITKGITGSVSSLITSIYTYWRSLLSAGASKVLSLDLKGIFDKGIEFVERVVKALAGIVANWIALARSATNINLNLNLPGLQEGGIATREMLARVGEAGPEAIIPLRDFYKVIEAVAAGLGSTYNSNVARDMAGSGQTLIFQPTLNFYGNVDQGQVRREVTQAGQDWVFSLRQ